MVRDFADGVGRKRGWFRRPKGTGLYLDGDFGVGKTHLLASTWHHAKGIRHYCSFSEAISLANILSPQKAIDHLAADLVCIDEFELDDPSNTRMADLLVHGLISRGARVMVTSNTIPGELGQGRMFVDQFRAQLQRIAQSFTDVHVPGKDYRQKRLDITQANPPHWGQTLTEFAAEGAPTIEAASLDRRLSDLPVVHLRAVASRLKGLAIRNLEPFPDQFRALRFVHFIDRLYDFHVPIRVSSSVPLREIFLEEYRDWAFAKKYRRCLSRLAESCSDTASPEGAPP